MEAWQLVERMVLLKFGVKLELLEQIWFNWISPSIVLFGVQILMVYYIAVKK